MDEILIFSKGEMRSVMLMLRGLKIFSMVSSLTKNVGKSNIYSTNMYAQEELSEVIGYAEGKIPLKYLGILITSKRWSQWI